MLTPAFATLRGRPFFRLPTLSSPFLKGNTIIIIDNNVALVLVYLLKFDYLVNCSSQFHYKSLTVLELLSEFTVFFHSVLENFN